MPNVTYISQVYPVDDRHVALSWQFFNKTAHNLRGNPHAVVQVVHPSTGQQFRIDLAPLRIERSGPVFEQMRKELVAIATQTGMTGLFRLRGALICQILSFEAVPCADQLCSQPEAIGLTAVVALSERLAICSDLDGLVDGLLAGLVDDLEMGAAIVFVLDEDGGRLSAIASRGYPESGIGARVSGREPHVGPLRTARTAGRADTRIGLPAYNDNLESRLILLRKRLEQRDAPIRMVKRGRGRFELVVSRPLRLKEQA